MLDNNPQNSNNKNTGGNNFFNKNPILVFAIFAIVTIFLFKSFVDGSGGLMDGSQSRNVPYSELKKMIENNEISQVSIGQTSIRAVTNQNTVLVSKKVSTSCFNKPFSSSRSIYSNSSPSAFWYLTSTSSGESSFFSSDNNSLTSSLVKGFSP